MEGPLSDDALAAHLATVLQRTAEALEASGARTEALADFQERRPILGIARSPIMVPRGRVWRLGVLLLDQHRALHTIGAVTRAVEPGRVTNQSARAEERRDYRRAAFQAKFAEGDTVNFDTTPIPLDGASIRGHGHGHDRAQGLLAERDGVLMVRWSRQAGEHALTPLEPYLAERAALLTAPPP
ncbi:hypothetical protein [Herbiconiux sp.]|uniref:hypothetical protein n=1 Tax=Herbiconiux sp. TaxID=1871186 RepID=UPI0025C318A0|nr:hypothetical protein [Herbiconiux sp.]